MASTKAACALCLLGLLPLAICFVPTLRQPLLQANNGAKAMCRQSDQPRFFALRMSEGASDVVAGIEETPDDDQRALKKISISKRTKDNKKPKKPLSDFQVGSTVPGKVVSIMPYGAFVDIGTTTDGLVHVSQLADEFVSDISTIVKVGDEVQVRIVSIETEINKISLSMRSESAERKPRAAREGGDSRAPGAGGDKKRSNSKELPEEFKNFDQQKVMKGKVVSVLDYGCFVALNDQVEALVHVSEMSDDRNVKPEAFVKVGEEVDVRIINYDKLKKRLSLSMKAYTVPEPRDETEDIRGYKDPEVEGAKTAFQLAWERAQKKSLAKA